MNQMFNWLSQKVVAVTLIALFGFINFSTVDARLIFTTEGDGTLIDQDLDGDSNFSLFFGAALGEEIEFDTANDRFNISNDIRVSGNVVTTGGVDIEGAAGLILQNDETITNTTNGTIDITATNTDISNNLNVGGNTVVTGTSDFQGSISDSLGALTFDDNTVTTGTSDFQGNISDSLGDLVVDDNLDVTGTTSLDGNTTVETGATFTVTDGVSTFGGAIDANSTSDFGGDITLSADSQIINLRAENQATGGAPVCTDATDLGRIYYDTDTEILMYCTFDGVSTYSYTSTSSAGAINVNTTFTPEFGSFATLADGSNNTGTLEADFDDTANHGFYQWTTRKNALHDYDLVVQWKVPENFSSFQANAITFTVKTATILATDNQIDLIGEDTAGAAITLSAAATDVKSAVADTWIDIDTTITGGTFTPGELTNFKFKVQSDNSNSGITYLGPVKINYITN